ncbi:MAG: DUF4091 domain-containing protein, partial [Thermoguttaceae bacterium]|nr:DUF4091 domain-containing protein [Thermoguttaceae bacterium]
GLAPSWDAQTQSFDWTEWDERFGPLFDGSAFADSPRGATPIEAFYLPLFENFPANIFTGYRENAWPDAYGFTPEYQATFRKASREMAAHMVEQKWRDVRFFFFLNNKSDYKRNGWSKASSPWLLDEPASFQDFAALRFFGRLFKEGAADVVASAGYAPIAYRIDISRPEWSRDSLDGAMDVAVVGGGAFIKYRRVVLSRKSRYGQIVYTYGSAVAPEESGWQPALWALDAWTLGVDGVVPWQTIGTPDSWKRGDELALFYPPVKESDGAVAASIRLKAFRRGEQDVEYLTALQVATGLPRETVAEAVRQRLKLGVESQYKSAEDAGVQKYNGAAPADLRRWRGEIGAFLSRSSR